MNKDLRARINELNDGTRTRQQMVEQLHNEGFKARSGKRLSLNAITYYVDTPVARSMTLARRRQEVTYERIDSAPIPQGLAMVVIGRPDQVQAIIKGMIQ